MVGRWLELGFLLTFLFDLSQGFVTAEIRLVLCTTSQLCLWENSKKLYVQFKSHLLLYRHLLVIFLHLGNSFVHFSILAVNKFLPANARWLYINGLPRPLIFRRSKGGTSCSTTYQPIPSHQHHPIDTHTHRERERAESWLYSLFLFYIFFFFFFPFDPQRHADLSDGRLSVAGQHRREPNGQRLARDGYSIAPTLLTFSSFFGKKKKKFPTQDKKEIRNKKRPEWLFSVLLYSVCVCVSVSLCCVCVCVCVISAHSKWPRVCGVIVRRAEY